MGRLRPEEISSILKGAITDYENRVRTEEVGQVLEVGDGIARVHGLTNVMYQEMVEFEDATGEKITGLALNLEEVLGRYEQLVKEHLGRIEVGVTTAVELSQNQLHRVKERLGSVLEGREVILETNVDPELIGGAVFRFGGRMMDGSIRGRLESLREGMLERSVV